MTKDEFRKAAEEQNSKAPPVKKDTASTQAGPPQPPSPGLLVPRPPFAMPVIPAAVKKVKIIKPDVLPAKDDESKES